MTRRMRKQRWREESRPSTEIPIGEVVIIAVAVIVALLLLFS